MEILYVPFDKRAEAQSLGAIWNPDLKKLVWPGTATTMPATLRRWFPQPIQKIPASNPTAVKPAPEQLPPQPTPQPATAPKPALAPEFAPAHTPTLQKEPPDTGPSLITLDVPFEIKPLASQYSVRWNKDWKCSTWYGKTQDFPPILQCCKALPYSWESYVANQLNNTKSKARPSAGKYILRDYQNEAVEEINNAFRHQYPGFLLADKAGLGKTLPALQAAYDNTPKHGTLCIIAPVSMLALWRETITQFGHPDIHIILLNYDRLNRLFLEAGTTKAKSLKGLARKGKLNIPVDVFIWDECQRLRNLTTARTKFALKTYETDALHIWASATAGQTPLELGYLLPLLAKTSDIIPTGNTPVAKFEDWCKKTKLNLTRGDFGKLQWEKNEAECEKLNKLLFTRKKGVIGAIRRLPTDIQGWPELQRILHPVQLTPEQAQTYELEWHNFQKVIQGMPATLRKSAEKGIAALTRFRQKASLLRTEDTINFAADLIEEGHQVAISCQWLKSTEAIHEGLLKKNIKSTFFTGENAGPEREENRKRFQRGKIPVILFTVEEGINLQEGEILPDDKPRAQINHDLRWSGIAMEQIDYRCHRNGKFAKVFWSYALDTKEIEVANRILQRLNSMASLSGDDKSLLQELETLFLNT